MKNIILINTNGEVLVSSINDGTNTLYINGTLIDSSQWIGSGSYTATVEGHAITIAKAPDLNGNIQLIRVSEYNYRLIKLRSFNNVLDVYQDGISVVGSDGIARITGGSSGANKNTWYGSSNTVAGTQTKVVTTTSGNFELEAGNIVVVKFTYAQTYSGSYKLDVDGTGAVTVMSKGTTGSERYCYVAGEAVAHVYDGTNFIAINEGIASTTYYGITKLLNSVSSTSTSMAATPNSVKQAYDLADSKQDELISGINIKTINNESLLGSGDVPIESGSEVSVSADLTTGTKIGTITVDGSATDLYAPSGLVTPADYVIEDGISGSWQYRKWNKGRIEAWYVGSVTMSATTSTSSGIYYRTSTLAVPSGIFNTAPRTIVGSAADDNTIIAVKGYAESNTSIKIRDYRTNSLSSTQARQIRVYAWNGETV